MEVLGIWWVDKSNKTTSMFVATNRQHRMGRGDDAMRGRGGQCQKERGGRSQE